MTQICVQGVIKSKAIRDVISDNPVMLSMMFSLSFMASVCLFLKAHLISFIKDRILYNLHIFIP